MKTGERYSVDVYRVAMEIVVLIKQMSADADSVLAMSHGAISG